MSGDGEVMDVETPPSPPMMKSLNEKLQRMELMLDQSNKKHEKELAEAREDNQKLRRSLNAVASNLEHRLRDKEAKQTPLEERKRKVAEAKSQFKSPQDKRAIGFLVDLGLDARDMATSLESLNTHREVLLTGEDEEEEQEMGPLDLRMRSVQRDVLSV